MPYGESHRADLCVTQLNNLTVPENFQADVTYPDTSNAFYRVGNGRLIHRLRQYDFGGSVLKRSQSCLHHYKQRVTVPGAQPRPQGPLSSSFLEKGGKEITLGTRLLGARVDLWPLVVFAVRQ